MPLQQELDARRAEFNAKAPPDRIAAYQRGVDELAADGIAGRAVNVGEKAPDFTLASARGEKVTLSTLLAQGPVVLTFYRGGWCPYCNMELHALQQALPEIRASGADLVAISPELPDKAMDTQARHALEFEVLSDVGNHVCEAFGLTFELPEQLRPIYTSIGIDIPAFNGDDSFVLPVPASYVVDSDGIIRHHFVNVDYTRRLEPDDLLQVLRGQ